MKIQTLLSIFLTLLVQTSVAQIDHWETTLYADGNWYYFPGESAPPSIWNLPIFNDSEWELGTGGIGYGDDDDNTIISPVPSLYLRQTFTVTDISKIEWAVLHADYDDAFVAYINGVEIARANIGGAPPAYDAEAIFLHEAKLYEGGLPEVFIMDDEEINQTLVEGENLLAVQVHNYDGIVSSDLSALFWFSFAINDESNDYGPVPAWFSSTLLSSHLPILKINTNGEEIPNEPAIEGDIEIIWNGEGNMNSSFDEPNELAVNISIERRGQSSLSFPKTGFAIETKNGIGEDMDVSFLNFPEEEDWVLHGPYSDKTLMRNVLTMKLARDMGQYASRTRFVELMVNGKYEGLYVIMEKIKRDENRVDIATLNEDDVEGDELTGGYIFKIDKDEADWYSQYDIINNPNVKLTFQYVSPREAIIQPEQETYIQNYVHFFETALKSPSLMFNGLRYDEFIDLNSFAEYLIINELSRNVDAYRLSTYLHKKKKSNGGKIHAGPIWDHNLGWSNADYCGSPSVEGWIYYEETCQGGNPFWWGVILGDEKFANTVNCRWAELREGPFNLDSILTFIDSQVELLGPAVDRNYERWPILNEYIWPNPVVVETYEEEIEIMKNWIAGRIAWMDENMFGECLPSALSDLSKNIKINISPNPASQFIQLHFSENESGIFDFKLFDVHGKTIFSKHKVNTEDVAKIDISSMPSGTLFCMIKMDGKTTVKQIIIGSK